MNLTFNPDDGANYPFSDITRRAFPDFGAISMVVRMGKSRYHALQTALIKRFSHHWQGGATYTLSGLWDAHPPAFSGLNPVPFKTTPDLGGEWSLSAGDLRHRAVLNGIWEVGRGLQLSSVFYTGIASAPPGRNGCATQLVHAAAATQIRRPGSAADYAAAPRRARRHCGGVQRLQFAELDHDDDGDESTVSEANYGTEPYGAGGIPYHVLTRLDCQYGFKAPTDEPIGTAET